MRQLDPLSVWRPFSRQHSCQLVHRKIQLTQQDLPFKRTLERNRAGQLAARQRQMLKAGFPVGTGVNPGAGNGALHHQMHMKAIALAQLCTIVDALLQYAAPAAALFGIWFETPIENTTCYIMLHECCSTLQAGVFDLCKLLMRGHSCHQPAVSHVALLPLWLRHLD